MAGSRILITALTASRMANLTLVELMYRRLTYCRSDSFASGLAILIRFMPVLGLALRNLRPDAKI